MSKLSQETQGLDKSIKMVYNGRVSRKGFSKISSVCLLDLLNKMNRTGRVRKKGDKMEKRHFSFCGSVRSCGTKELHEPHVIGDYVSAQGDRCETFCTGMSGPGLKVVREGGLAGNPGDPTTWSGYAERYDATSQRAPIVATFVFTQEARRDFTLLYRRLEEWRQNQVRRIPDRVEVLCAREESSIEGWRPVYLVGEQPTPQFADGCEVTHVGASAGAIAQAMVLGPGISPSLHEHHGIFRNLRLPWGSLYRSKKTGELWVRGGRDGAAVFVPEH